MKITDKTEINRSSSLPRTSNKPEYSISRTKRSYSNSKNHQKPIKEAIKLKQKKPFKLVNYCPVKLNFRVENSKNPLKIRQKLKVEHIKLQLKKK